MDNKLYLVIFILFIAAIRFPHYIAKGNYKFLYVSLAVQLISLGYGLSFYSFIDYKGFIGGFGNNLRLELSTLFALFLITKGYTKKDRINISNKLLLFLIIILIIISFINPYNKLSTAILVPIFFYFQLWILFYVIKSNFSSKDIFKGIYDSFLILTLIQLVLSICYPVLGLNFIGELFTSSLEESLKREGVISALGTYGHPSSLAIISLLFAVFFASSYWNNYKMKLSLFLLFANIFIVYLTYSRTSYLISFFIFIIAYNLYSKKLFSIKTILFLGLSIFLLISMIYFTDLGEMFLKSDSEQQVINRTTHWLLGFELWEKSKIIGLGINSHVYYMENYLHNSTLGLLSELEFFITRPIHNIHVIVLVETGIIGILTWFYFFFNKLKENYYKSYSQLRNVKILNVTSFSVLLLVLTYGFMGFGIFLRETSAMILMLIYFSSISYKHKF